VFAGSVSPFLESNRRASRLGKKTWTFELETNEKWMGARPRNSFDSESSAPVLTVDEPEASDRQPSAARRHLRRQTAP
jgi:hypothetical protein